MADEHIDTYMTRKRTALVLGGSGSVGLALIRELLNDDAFGTVIALLRRPLPRSVAKLQTAGHALVQRLVPEMTPNLLAAATMEAVRGVASGEVEGFSVLGVGAGTAALSLEEHRAVDVH
jgi:NAD(P)-dependent dehydrogenase (short-subunit alcohol dehydrogenase family)